MPVALLSFLNIESNDKLTKYATPIESKEHKLSKVNTQEHKTLSLDFDHSLWALECLEHSWALLYFEDHSCANSGDPYLQTREGSQLLYLRQLSSRNTNAQEKR